MPFGTPSKSVANARTAALVPRPSLSSYATATKQERNLSYGPSGKPAAKSPIRIDNSESRGLRAAGSLEAAADQRNDINRPRPDQESEKVRSSALMLSHPTEMKICHECHTKETSTWRRDMAGNLICNKCGLRKRKDHKAPSRRPLKKSLKSDEVPERNSVADQEQDPALEAESQASNAPENVTPDSQSRRHIAKPHQRTSTDIISITSLIDPRPPRPWVNHSERIPSNLLAPPTPSEPFTTSTQAPMSPSQSVTGSQPRQEFIVPEETSPENASSNSNFAPYIVPSRRRGAKRALDPLTNEYKVCVSCKTEESPAWRRGPDGRTLCNKCMLRGKRAAIREANRTMLLQLNNDNTPSREVESASKGNSTSSSQRQSNQLPARTESQIVLDNYTYLNFSFNSENMSPSSGHGRSTEGADTIEKSQIDETDSTSSIDENAAKSQLDQHQSHQESYSDTSVSFYRSPKQGLPSIFELLASNI